MSNQVTPGVGPILAWVHDLNNLSRDPLDNATCQISKLYDYMLIIMPPLFYRIDDLDANNLKCNSISICKHFKVQLHFDMHTF